MERFTQIQVGAFEKIQINAGVILKEFLKFDENGAIQKPDKAVFDKNNIIGVTSGGINFASNPEFVDFGEDMDNVPPNTWQLKRVTSFNPVLSGTMVTLDKSTAAYLMGGSLSKVTESDTSEMTTFAQISRIRPPSKILGNNLPGNSAFQNLWFVGDYSTSNDVLMGNFIAIHLKNALSTGGFQWQSTKDGKGQFAFEFTGHYDLENPENAPFDLYIKWPDNASEAV